MKNLLAMVGRELQWHRPAIFQRRYELRSGDVVVAELTFPSAFRVTATATTGEGSWEFRRSGFVQSTIAVRDNTTASDIATFADRRFRREILISLSDGSEFVIGCNFFATECTLKGRGGELLARQGLRGFLPRIRYVEIRHAAKSCPQLSWLVPLMWYYTLLRRRRGHRRG